MRTPSKSLKNPKKTRNLPEIETVKITDLKPHWDAVHVDLSRLSQPLLLHLVTLVKLLLQWFKKETNGSNKCKKNEKMSYHKDENDLRERSLKSLMHRLCAVSTAALSVLMVRYPDTITDAAQDVHTVRDIITVALQSTNLSFFPVLSRVNNMWAFAQARVLERREENVLHTIHSQNMISGKNVPEINRDVEECSPGPFNLPIGPSSAIIEDGSSKTKERNKGPGKVVHLIQSSFPVIIRNEKEAEEEGVGVGEKELDPLSFDPISRAHREALSEILVYHRGISASRCLQLLEFFMGNEEALKNYLKENSMSIYERNCFDVEMETDLELSDENPLRNTSVCDPFYQAKSDLLIAPWENFVPSDAHFDRLVVHTVGNCEERTMFAMSTSSGSTDGSASAPGVADVIASVRGIRSDGVGGEDADAEGRGEKESGALPGGGGGGEEENNVVERSRFDSSLALGCCLAHCDDEGPSPFPKGNPMRLCMSPGAVRTNTIVSMYDFNLGTTTCEQLESSNLRVVSKYFDRPVESMPVLVQDLDMAVTILRLREIATQLLADGNLNLHSDAQNIRDWLDVLKVLVFSESKGLADGTDMIDGKRGLLVEYNVTQCSMVCYVMILYGVVQYRIT